VGSTAVTTLANGNFLVSSTSWGENRGAVTWASSTAGVSGMISEANSLVGSNPGDLVGNSNITMLSSGNYLVSSPNWNGGHGAVTWCSGATGLSGLVSEVNSLVGSNPDDFVGSAAVTTLSSGNYVVTIPTWNGYRGAVTWGDGGIGVSGVVSEANSLVGSYPDDRVGAWAPVARC
jgi:hypothetical protein